MKFKLIKHINFFRLLVILIFLFITIFTLSMSINKKNKYYQGAISTNFNGKIFHNQSNESPVSIFKILKYFATTKKAIWPKKVNITYDIPPKIVNGTKLRVSNVGHVTFLIQTQGLNILTDPVWSERASPVKFAGPKRVSDPGIHFKDLPKIDLIWISHNHYDHLDLCTIKKLWDQFKPRIITPLGNDKIIQSRYPYIKVETYDWDEIVYINEEVQLVLSAMQHWSARGIFDRNQALWAALTIKTPGGNIYFVGDSGYGNGKYFKQDKKQFKQFRLVLLPMGAYIPRKLMSYSHMNPEEMIKAHIDLGCPFTIPSHYDVFPLARENFGQALIDLKLAKQNYDCKEIKILEPGNYCYVPEISN